MNDRSDWQERWDIRLAALESVLGKADETILHAAVPFSAGFEAGGGADVLQFHQAFEGVAYVTAELIGNPSLVKADFGGYELAIVHRQESDWCPNLISRLAYYCLEERLNPGETMALGDGAPSDSSLVALFFTKLGTFEVRGDPSGILSCIGITQSELDTSLRHGSAELEQRLRSEGIYPFTDFNRPSVA